MSGKVKITQKQAVAIECARKLCKSDENIIETHIKADKTGWFGDMSGFEDMPTLDLIDALRIGYEVEPEYKVGDLVVYDDETYEIYHITYIGKVSIKRDEKSVLSISVEFIRHATPEEVKAEQGRQLWRKINREVGELKLDDVVFLDSGSCLIIECPISMSRAKSHMRYGDIARIYPAESHISFEDGG